MVTSRLMAATLVIIGGASRASGQTPAADSVTAILRVAPISVSGYQRYGFPRRDLTVRVGDVTVAPGLALGGWVGFVGSADHTMVAGDLVVTAAELPAVVRSLTGDRIAITAIHNHLAGETPNVLYVHIHQMGPPGAIATAIDRANRDPAGRRAGTAAARDRHHAGFSPARDIRTGPGDCGLGFPGGHSG
jgi:hypothetical protein